MKRLLLASLLLPSLIAAQVPTYHTGQILTVGSALPGTCNAGEAYIKNTATVGLYVCTAANTWTSGAGVGATVFPSFLTFTAPVSSDFAWINQGGATIDATTDGVYLIAPAGGRSHRIRKKAAPATPYTITAAFMVGSQVDNYHEFGLIFRQSSDGKKTGIAHQYNGGWLINSTKWDTDTTFNANYVSQTWGPMVGQGVVTWLRITDNGTNRIVYHSLDGSHWIQLHSVGRTDYLTADEVGWFVDGDGAFDFHVLLKSWAQS